MSECKSDIFTVSRSFSRDIRIKRSRFIGTLLPSVSRESAEQEIALVKERFHDATHNCYSYRIDEQNYRYSDDGEPSGTAGKPILSMLEKYRLWQITLVVTRYYGGIKLGTGGLIRAYSQCAEETIKNSRLEKFVRYQRFQLDYPYHLSRNIQYLIAKFDSLVDDSLFAESISQLIRVPMDHVQHFTGEIDHISNGMIELKQCDDRELR